MINGRYDFFFPVETSQLPLFRLLGAPAQDKLQVITEGGHAGALPRRRLLAVRPVRHRARQRAVPLVPLLVIRLRDPELPRGSDLGGDPIAERLLRLVARSERRLLLLDSKSKDRRAILRSAVGALAVAAGGIVRLPEELQELLIAHLRGIELDQHRLGGPGPVPADVLVTGVLGGAPPRPDSGRPD